MGHGDEEELLGAAGGPPTARRFIALLQTLEAKEDAEKEWRKLEQQWLATLLHQSVIAFDDVQVAAELLARHGWENTGTGTARGRAAFLRLQQLRHRRGVDALACWQSMGDDVAS
jgi:alkyl sulfatase BDS1-like metallo-beta-lactamase superfamily hydrolase